MLMRTVLMTGVVATLLMTGAARADALQAIELLAVPTLDEGDMARLDGRADTSMEALLNDTRQNAQLTGNQLTSQTTGMNLAGQGIFAGSTGISTLIQNTGNQVLIQQSTQVNVLFRP